MKTYFSQLKSYWPLLIAAAAFDAICMLTVYDIALGHGVRVAILFAVVIGTVELASTLAVFSLVHDFMTGDAPVAIFRSDVEEENDGYESEQTEGAEADRY